jgi:5'-nucleotidase/UDP-sugar diphosphatase
MKRLRLSIVLFVSFLPLFAQTEKNITILHTNDLHSRLMGFAPESAYSPMSVNDDKTVGGFSRIASIISTEKNSYKEITLVVDAGDFMMGTLFPSLEKNTVFSFGL